MDCSPPDSSVHGILQARILVWVACPPPGDLAHPGIKLESPALPADSLSAELLGKFSGQIRKWHGAGKVVWEKSGFHSGVGKPLQDFKKFKKFCHIGGNRAKNHLIPEPM